MRFSIRLKMMTLGALISVLTMGTAILLSDTIYRNNNRKNLVGDVDSWLASVKEDAESDVPVNDYRPFSYDIYDYMLKQYEAAPEPPESFENFEKEKSWYKNYYNWSYPFDNYSMHFQTEAERNYRAVYKDFVYLLVDGKMATGAISIFIFFFDMDNNRLVFMADESSYIANYKNEYHLPGSYISNVNTLPVADGDFYKYEIEGKLVHCIPIPSPEDNTLKPVWYAIQFSYEAVDVEANHMAGIITIALSITALFLMLMFFIFSHLLVTKNVLRLSKSTVAFTENLKKKDKLVAKDPDIKSKDEIKDLSNSFYAMEEELINYVDLITKETQDKERMNAELSVASKIQLEALPNSNYDDQNCSLRAFIKTAKEVGGDFYDYFYLDDNRLLVTICDVSGKGVPAALFMMKGKELIKSSIISGSTLEQAVYQANNELVKNNTENLFITAFIGIADFKKHELKFVNAGHEKPYILSKGKVIKLDGNSNFVLGGVGDFEYQAEKTKFDVGDRLFLFTDGLNEAINNEREEFSYERVEKVLKAEIDASLDDLIDSMNKTQSAFVASEEVFDDVTMVALQFNDNNFTLSYKEKDLNVVTEIVDELNKRFSFFEEKFRSEICVIVDEIVTNIVSYSEVENLEFSVGFEMSDSGVTITFKDNGKKFNPLQNKDKYLEEFQEDLAVGGFGITLVKSLSTSQKYQYKDGCNIFTIVKDFAKGE